MVLSTIVGVLSFRLFEVIVVPVAHVISNDKTTVFCCRNDVSLESLFDSR